MRILEGEDKMVSSECKELFRVELKGLTPEPVPTARIEVKLEITDSAILRCWAKDLVSGKEGYQEIQYSTGLTDEEVQQKREELRKNLQK